jgi:hypothetical protein
MEVEEQPANEVIDNKAIEKSLNALIESILPGFGDHTRRGDIESRIIATHFHRLAVACCCAFARPCSRFDMEARFDETLSNH